MFHISHAFFECFGEENRKEREKVAHIESGIKAQSVHKGGEKAGADRDIPEDVHRDKR